MHSITQHKSVIVAIIVTTLIVIGSLYFFFMNNEEVSSSHSQEIGVAYSEQSDIALIGEACGKPIDKFCDEWVAKCDYKDGDITKGVCRDVIKDKDITCTDGPDPVCGEMLGAKFGFYNKCEADRHSADIINDGPCKIEQNIRGNCSAKMMAIRTCGVEQAITGFEFTGGKCQLRSVVGCEAEVPFTSLQDCQNTCE